MFTEDYKKKYEEALKRAKELNDKLIKNGTLATSKGIESIFPELKESEVRKEDEEVRQYIIRIMKQRDINVPMVQKAITWLEKQGEQKPFDYENANIQQKDFAPKGKPKFKVGDKIVERAFDECYDGIIKEIKNGKYFFENGDCVDIKEQNLWQLVEQKPAWSEEDENGLGDALWAIQQARTIAKDENDMGNLWYAENWIKSLKERYTWKPSESDILLLERIANGKSNPQDFQASLGGLIGQLKKLKEE